jgi:Sigma-70 region 2
MEEHEVVAAIVAGDPSGFAEALDIYAAPLFAYCRSILPQAEAADVVGDTFVIARAKLDGLRDPGKLSVWLQAVARNECLRRVIAKGDPPREPAGTAPGAALTEAQLAEAQPPEGLTGRILKICTDETPTGRAYRTTVTHLAGPFGHDGFPRPVSSARRRRLPKMSMAIAGIAAAVVLVIAVIVVALSGGSHPGQASADAATGPPGGATAPTPTVSGTGTSGTSPSGAGASSPGNGGKGTNGGATPTTPATPHATQSASRKSSSPNKTNAPDPAPTSPQPAPVTTAPPPPPPTPTPSPSAAPTPRATGALILNPLALSLTSRNDLPAQAVFTISAFGGPVRDFTVDTSTTTGHLVVSPVTGSLGTGQQTEIMVTGWGKTSFTGQIHVYPGDHVITVRVTAIMSKA